MTKIEIKWFIVNVPIFKLMSRKQTVAFGQNAVLFYTSKPGECFN